MRFEYSWSDLMGILIFFWRCRYRLFWISMKLSMSILNIHEVTSWVFWMFKRWRHGNIKKLTSWVFWIFMKWPLGFLNIHWYFEYEVTLRKYSEADVMGILKFVIKITRLLLNIQIPMTSLCEYSNTNVIMNIQNNSKYLCHIFKITLLLNIQNTHDVTLWIFKIPMPYG